MSVVPTDVWFGEDPLKNLHEGDNFSDKLEVLHAAIKRNYPFVDRIAIALYDEKVGLLKSFIKSGDDDPVAFYSCNIEDAPSLKQVRDTGQPRVVNDLNLFSSGSHRHTRKIDECGYQASYTVPIFNAGTMIGMVFFNSYTKYVFSAQVINHLNAYAQIINGLVINKLTMVRTIIGAFRGALSLVSNKDNETGNHLERMSRYTRLIASQLANSNGNKYNLTDETIEHLYLFSPLHDIGKIGIPDAILLKPGRLNENEWEVMKTHSAKGGDVVDTILEQLGLPTYEHSALLSAITELHHETLDGMGYPNGLRSNEIPIESMIVAVADIFDALTSQRPYKEAWSVDDAFDELGRLSEHKLNKDCVNALFQIRPEIDQIRLTFAGG